MPAVHAVQHSILGQRLQDEPRHTIALQCRLHLIVYVKFIAVPYFLYRKIVIQVSHFLLQRQKLVLLDQRALEQRAERVDPLTQDRDIVEGGEPTQRIQRIEQEMRVDLVAQRIQLQLPLAHLVLLPLTVHLLQLPDQVVQGARQEPDLVRAGVPDVLVHLLVREDVAAIHDMPQRQHDAGIDQQRRRETDCEQQRRQPQQMRRDPVRLVADIAFRHRYDKITLVGLVIVKGHEVGAAVLPEQEGIASLCLALCQLRVERAVTQVAAGAVILAVRDQHRAVRPHQKYGAVRPKVDPAEDLLLQRTRVDVEQNIPDGLHCGGVAVDLPPQHQGPGCGVPTERILQAVSGGGRVDLGQQRAVQGVGHTVIAGAVPQRPIHMHNLRLPQIRSRRGGALQFPGQLVQLVGQGAVRVAAAQKLLHLRHDRERIDVIAVFFQLQLQIAVKQLGRLYGIFPHFGPDGTGIDAVGIAAVQDHRQQGHAQEAYEQPQLQPYPPQQRDDAVQSALKYGQFATHALPSSPSICENHQAHVLFPHYREQGQRCQYSPCYGQSTTFSFANIAL